MTNNTQLAHQHHQQSQEARSITLLCDHLRSPANMGAIFRLADAFGVEEIIFAGNFPDLTSNRLKKTARNTHTVVCFRKSDNAQQSLRDLHEQGYQSIALEITSESKALQEIDVTSIAKKVLILGDENHGISTELLAMAHFTAHIPMHGTNSSMNVAQASAIALYVLTTD